MTDLAKATSQLSPIVQTIVSGHGCILEDLSIRRAGRRLLIQVIVDHESHLDLDVVAKISRELDQELELTNFFGEQGYTLEVSSPGVDRPLSLPRHYRKNIDRLIQFELVTGNLLTGRLEKFEDETFYLEDGTTLLFAEVKAGQVQIEFNRKPKGAADEADDLSDADFEDENYVDEDAE
ncbi:MAG: hypothetical protein RL038_1211 [Actinomycetota bacterium]